MVCGLGIFMLILAKKNDLVAFLNGDTLWGTMISNRATGAGQPFGLTFLKTDGTEVKLSSTILKKVDSYSIGLGKYVYHRISYFPEQNRPKKFYVIDKTYYVSTGINIFQFKSIAIITNRKKGTMKFIEFVPATARDITPRKFYVFSLKWGIS